jgi:hypothetical protein
MLLHMLMLMEGGMGVQGHRVQKGFLIRGMLARKIFLTFHIRISTLRNHYKRHIYFSSLTDCHPPIFTLMVRGFIIY